jgi:menaquinone-9 beta-reductase
MFASHYAAAQDCGPLASFESSESWLEYPYRDGVALIGDAAATTDPSYGQGMSLTMRDVRVLRDELSGDSDWDRAGRSYARQHRGYFSDCHIASGWFRHIFQEQTPAAMLHRQKAMPLIAEDPTRVPDHLNSGPDLPVDDAVRARFFGES